ncbi:type II toxin-antitoxin system VapB family antitoxin [Mesorhizobium sp. LNHC229A00]|nr:type II toxin-antitoxin system VapB family antitoxin [Mesorhizobium sp. LNHC229A00]
MNLQIRDPRARELAQGLAAKRKISMTEAVIEGS